MARLTAEEFNTFLEELVTGQGLGKVQDRLVRLNAVVSRRRLGSAQALARQLYPLTGGLDRDATPTRVLLALWEDFLGSRIGEETGKRLDELAEKVNACLEPSGGIQPDREAELHDALSAYRNELTTHVGESVARLTMLCRAVPEVARILRTS